MMLRWVLALLLVLISLPSTPPSVARAQRPLDYPLPLPGGAHFFTQTDGQNGATGTGYVVSNADGIPFWTFFQQVGGVAAVGYPVSHRFIWNGFVVQAFQKVVFQWRPEVGTVYYVNVLDEMHNRGLDPWLLAVRQTPPPADWSSDAGLPFDQVIARHLALLEANPAIRAAYYAEEDTINRNGLPMAPIQDMGGVMVLRAQRKVFQQWLVDTPWARAGQVVVANGGDLGKEAGLYPVAATTPLPPSMVPLSVVEGSMPPGATPTPGTPCNGDERMSFTPSAPVVGQQTFVQVTSARAATNVNLTSPQTPVVFTGVGSGGLGVIWTWSFTPLSPGRYDFTFTIDNVPCTANFVNVGAMSATPTASPPAGICPTNFPVTVNPSSPRVNQTFTISLEGPSTSFGLQTILGIGVQSVEGPTGSPGRLTATVQVQLPGTYEYQYYINGRVCQSITIAVQP